MSVVSQARGRTWITGILVGPPRGGGAVYFEGAAHRSGDSTILDDPPEGLDVRITSAGGGEELETEDVPSWLFSSMTDDRGHEPYAKVDIPEEGEYLIAATDEATGGFGKVPQGGAADNTGPEVTLGERPWNPLAQGRARLGGQASAPRRRPSWRDWATRVPSGDQSSPSSSKKPSRT